MDSPTAVSRCKRRKSKKRVFAVESSSSACNDVEVLELSPPVKRSSRPKSSKQKEVIHHEIIDVDILEDLGDVIVIDDDVNETFKKFDIVEDYSDHHYAKNGSSSIQPPKNWAKRVREEWRIFEKDLPDMIFVRAYESRMDLLRAVIVGAQGTPYHDGLFFFDVRFPSDYPNSPPLVYFHAGGLQINPNLYCNGYVCLSLLNTWSGSKKEKWIAGTSTMLQVLVSIQGLVLNAKPYFNEPGYASMIGSEDGEQASFQYNESTFISSLRIMTYKMRTPPKHFEVLVQEHFQQRARDILVACKAYIGGAQVGSLVKGGVQDVDEGHKSCSQHFKNNLAEFIKTLINSFSQIGVKNCEEFLPLTKKASKVKVSNNRPMMDNKH